MYLANDQGVWRRSTTNLWFSTWPLFLEITFDRDAECCFGRGHKAQGYFLLNPIDERRGQIVIWRRDNRGAASWKLRQFLSSDCQSATGQLHHEVKRIIIDVGHLFGYFK